MKIYYSKARRRFEVAEWRKGKGLVLLDYDTDFDALAIRQGFIIEDDEETEDNVEENKLSTASLS